MAITYFNPFHTHTQYCAYAGASQSVSKYGISSWYSYLNGATEINAANTSFLHTQSYSANSRGYIYTNSHVRAFYNCTSLQKITGLGSSIGDGSLAYTFCNCTNLTTVTELPPNVTVMNATFKDCPNLTTIPVIPNSVISIGSCFDGCTNLQGDIYIYSPDINYSTSCFNNTSLRKQVHIPFHYTNGEYTSTYNVFVAEYGSGQNGVVLMDLNSGAIV